MYGLRRIIQIDGFVPGVRTVINVDGHSIITGTNGAGKTSTLKLIPFFYGIEPGRIASTVAGRGSFLDFYLPRKTSLLIFEYAREGGLCCVVVSQHSSGIKHIYRFLASGFCEEHFSKRTLAGDAVYRTCNELAEHWGEQNLTSSRQLENVLDYRGVIQNDPVLINRSGGRANLRAMANDYCVGGLATHMQHMGRVCLSIISRSGNMESMKQMLGDIMVEEDRAVIPDPPVHSAGQSLIDNINSLRTFNRDLPMIHAVIEKHRDRLSIEERLHEYGCQIKHTETALGEAVTRLQDALDKHDAQAALFRENWDVEYANLKKDVIDARQEELHVEKTIKDLERRADDYKKQNMAQKVADFDQLDVLMEQAKEASERYQRLTKAVKSEDDRRARQCEDAHQQYVVRHEEIQTKLDDANTIMLRQEREHKALTDDIRDQQASEVESIRNKFNAEDAVLLQALGIARGKAENGGPTGVETDDLERLREVNDTSDEALHAARQRHDVTVSDMREKEQERDQYLATLRRAEKDHAKDVTARENLHSLLYAQDGTWLKQLRTFAPDWVLNVGKVIAPELLQRKDLQAERIADDSANLFGWTINLDAIEAPVSAQSEDELRLRFKAQEDKVAKARQHVEKCEGDCKKANVACKSAADSVDKCKHELRGCTAAQNNARDHYKARTQEINKAVEARRAAAAKNADDLHVKLAQSKEVQEKRKKEIKQRYAENLTTTEEAWGREKQRLELDITLWQKRKLVLAKGLEQTLVQIEEDFKQQCSDKGIDSSVIQEAGIADRQAQEKVTSVVKTAGDVQAYRLWLSDVWPEHKTFLSTLAERQRERVHVENILAEREARHKQKVTEMTAQRQVLSSDLKRHRLQREQLQGLLQHNDRCFGDKKATPHDIPFEALCRETMSLLQENKVLRESLMRNMQVINGNIERFNDSSVSAAWLSAKESLRQNLAIESTQDEDYILMLPQALESFLEQSISSIKQVLIESIMATGQSLATFRSQLFGVHRLIVKRSGMIKAAINKNMDIEALSSLEVLLVSRIEGQDYWAPLEDFYKSWSSWREDGGDKLPEQSFLDHMSTLLRALSSIKTGQSLVDYFDLHIKMVENGHERVIRNDRQLENSTSDGLKYLALCMIYIAVSRMLCPDHEVNLHWPVDELGLLHGENVAKLFGMLDRAGIVMVGGFPNGDPATLRYFKHCQHIDIHEGVTVMRVAQSSLLQRARALGGQKSVGWE